MFKTSPLALFCVALGACVAGKPKPDAGKTADAAIDASVEPKKPGEKCKQKDECSSGFCVDGVCCNQASCAPCNRCDVKGKEGDCTPEPDGTSCGVGSCTNSKQSDLLCELGACKTKELSCGSYQCDATGKACRSACTGDKDCIVGAFCENTLCKMKKSKVKNAPWQKSVRDQSA